NFLFQDDNGNGGNGNGGSLPQAIIDYIAANYPSNSIREWESSMGADSTLTYKVHLDSGLELYFDADGNFIRADDHNGNGNDGQEIAVAVSDLPQAIIDYLAANYPNNSISRAHKKFEDGRWVYRIKLDNDLKLFFDLAGNFLWLDD
ncbi:MAG: hypothetical protein D6730_25450, partial [Bacteroidetes bacterium]